MKVKAGTHRVKINSHLKGNMFIKNKKGVSLIEVMIALTMLSMLVLPAFMFIVEYTRGGSNIGDHYEVLNKVEERLEAALAMNFYDIPDGKSTNVVIESENGRKLDLKPIKIGANEVSFDFEAETLPVSFAAMKDAETRQLQKATLDDGMKKITITANWGKGKRKQNIQMIVYKANL